MPVLQSRDEMCIPFRMPNCFMGVKRMKNVYLRLKVKEIYSDPLD